MKLLLLSDLHLEFADFQPSEALDFDVAVLAGDIVSPGTRLFEWVRDNPALRRARAVVAVAGNHEYYHRVLQHEAQAMHQAAQDATVPPVHLLDCTQVVLGGVRFLGCTLWTDFELRIDTPAGPLSDRERGIAAARRAMVDYRAIRVDPHDEAALRRLEPLDTLQMHLTQRDWLARVLAEPFDGTTVVVTHHGPQRGSLAPRHAADWVSAAYISELPASFFSVPRLWVHGHTHTSRDYQVGPCRVLCNPRGYQPRGAPLPENAQFDPGLVVDLSALAATPNEATATTA